MIFILDDDLATCDSLRVLFETAGLEAQAFSSPEAFLEDATFTGRDCLILDVHMPRISGVEFLEQLRHAGNDVPVIIMTGAPSATISARANAAGALAILKKPFNASQLLSLAATAAS
jgi:two-component system, LuxR family, response regulator FixJ